MSTPHDSTIPDGYKRCTRCGEVKPVDAFTREKGATGGRRNQCKACRALEQKQRRQADPEGYARSQREWRAGNAQFREWTHTYYAEHKDTINAKRREWRQANPDKALAQDRARYERDGKHINEARQARRVADPEKYRRVERRWREVNRDHLVVWRREYQIANRERRTASHREWVAANRERHNAWQREYYRKHPEKVAIYAKAWREANPERRKLSHHRRSARKRGLPDTMTLEDRAFALDYFGHRCAICGCLPDFWTVLAWEHWIPLSSPDCPGTIPTNMLPVCHAKKDGRGSCNLSKHDKHPLLWLRHRFGPRKAKEIERRIQTFFDLVRRRTTDAA